MKRTTRLLLHSVAASLFVVCSAMAGLPPPPGGGGRAGLIFPSVVDAIYDGKFEKVPDDLLFRNYVVSIYKGMNDECEAGSPSDARAALQYGFPDAYARMTGNPFSVLGDLFKGIIAYRDSGDIEALENAHPASAIKYTREAVEDAGTLVTTYKCNSWEIRQLRTRVSQLIELRRLQTPEPDDSRRFVLLMHPRYREILGLSLADYPPPAKAKTTPPKNTPASPPVAKTERPRTAAADQQTPAKTPKSTEVAVDDTHREASGTPTADSSCASRQVAPEVGPQGPATYLVTPHPGPAEAPVPDFGDVEIHEHLFARSQVSLDVKPADALVLVRGVYGIFRYRGKASDYAKDHELELDEEPQLLLIRKKGWRDRVIRLTVTAGGQETIHVSLTAENK